MKIDPGSVRRTLHVLLLMAGVVAGSFVVGGLLVAPVAAQDTVTTDCRCVDASGEPIEGCICVQTLPRGDLWAELPFARRAVVGVSIDYAQGPDVDARGAEMVDVLSDGPADRAGMRAGDIVTHIDGRSVFDPLPPLHERALSEEESLPVQRFAHLIGQLEPGKEIEIRYLRGGQEYSATVVPEAPTAAPLAMWSPSRTIQPRQLGGILIAPDVEVTAPGIRITRDTARVGSLTLVPAVDLCRRPGDDPTRSIRLFGLANCVAGVDFVELTPGLGEYFGTDRGVLVADVAEASELGVRPGDVLLAVDGRAVDSVESARRILTSYVSGEELRLRVMRRGSETEVTGRMP